MWNYYYTGLNSGVGVRTQKGNVSLYRFKNETIEDDDEEQDTDDDLIDDEESVTNIFESVQGEKKFFLVHTETKTEGRIYVYRDKTAECVKWD